MAEKLRSGSAEAEAALARAGRYQEVAGGLRVKEVRVSAHERFVVCHNPEAAERDAAVRARLLARLAETIAGSDELTPTKRAELRGAIGTKPGLARLLRTTPGGLLRVDEAAVKAEEQFDGKLLLRCSDPTLSAADIALGYRQLGEVERGWRDMKQVLDLRPVYHRREDRIRAHVVLCWLALLLVRVTETSCGDTWPNLRRELEKLQLGSFRGAAGSFRQRTEVTPAQRAILAKLQLAVPPLLHELTPAIILSFAPPRRIDTRRLRASACFCPAKPPRFVDYRGDSCGTRASRCGILVRAWPCLPVTSDRRHFL